MKTNEVRSNFYWIFLIFFFNNCANNSISTSLKVFSSENIKVPVKGDYKYLSNLTSLGDSIIYKSSNLIYYYDYKKEILSSDTLSDVSYHTCNEARLVGVTSDKLIFMGANQICFFSNKTKELTTKNLKVPFNNLYSDYTTLFYGNSYGYGNRSFTDFIPLVTGYSFKQKVLESASSNIFFMSEDTTIPQKVVIPNPQTLQLLEAYPMVGSPYIEPSLKENHFNFIFPVSCMVYEVNIEGEVNTYSIEGPGSFKCKENNEEFKYSNNSSVFPINYNIYGNIYPDFYRQKYIQLVESELTDINGTRNSFINVLDDKFNLVKSLKFSTDDYFGQFLILRSGVYIRQANPIDDSHVYFDRIVI